MSTGRVCMAAAILAAIAMVVVHLRSEQTRCAAKMLTLESRWVQLRRERWALEARAARLQTPHRVRQRVVAQQAHLLSPEMRVRSGAPVHLASDHPRE